MAQGWTSMGPIVMISYTLLWILVVVSRGSSTVTQLGPFVDAESCQRVLKIEALKQNDKTCVQVNMLVTPIRQPDTQDPETSKPSPRMTRL